MLKAFEVMQEITTVNVILTLKYMLNAVVYAF